MVLKVIHITFSKKKSYSHHIHKKQAGITLTMLASMTVLYSGFPTTNICPGRRHLMIILDSFRSAPVANQMALDLSLKNLNSLSQTIDREINKDEFNEQMTF